VRRTSPQGRPPCPSLAPRSRRNPGGAPALETRGDQRATTSRPGTQALDARFCAKFLTICPPAGGGYRGSAKQRPRVATTSRRASLATPTRSSSGSTAVNGEREWATYHGGEQGESTLGLDVDPDNTVHLVSVASSSTTTCSGWRRSEPRRSASRQERPRLARSVSAFAYIVPIGVEHEGTKSARRARSTQSHQVTRAARVLLPLGEARQVVLA